MSIQWCWRWLHDMWHSEFVGCRQGINKTTIATCVEDAYKWYNFFISCYLDVERSGKKASFWACLPENMDTAMSRCKEEQITIIIPWDLIYLKLELLFCSWSMSTSINKSYKIFFVTYSNSAAIWRPANVDILPF